MAELGDRAQAEREGREPPEERRDEAPRTEPAGPRIAPAEPRGPGIASTEPAGAGIAPLEPAAGRETDPGAGALETVRRTFEETRSEAEDAFAERPEIFVGGAFAGGLALALVLRALGRG
jgi:hypothetical protein